MASLCSETPLKGDSTNSNFERLPPEIKIMICKLALIKDEPILVTSRRRKNQRFVYPNQHFAGLMRVNKKIAAEASVIFYSSNTFAIGDGVWGSRSSSNQKGLIDFVKSVPKDYVALIKNVEFHFHCSSSFDLNYLYADSLHVSREEAPSEFRQMARLILKNFTGVHILAARLKWHKIGQFDLTPHVPLPPLTKEEWNRIGHCFTNLLLCPAQKKFIVDTWNTKQFENLLKDVSAAGRVSWDGNLSSFAMKKPRTVCVHFDIIDESKLLKL